MKASSRDLIAALGAQVDQLRARVEVDLARPAVLAITSGLNRDGKDITTSALALSLARAGYRTLFIDAGFGKTFEPKGLQPATLSDAIRNTILCEGGLRVAFLNDPALQRSISQGVVVELLSRLRQEYDYIVVSVECALANALAVYVVGSADAVMATVRTGRRQKSIDAALAAKLKRAGSRFLGVLSIDPAVAALEPVLSPMPHADSDGLRVPRPSVHEELHLREVAEWHP